MLSSNMPGSPELRTNVTIALDQASIAVCGNLVCRSSAVNMQRMMSHRDSRCQGHTKGDNNHTMLRSRNECWRDTGCLRSHCRLPKGGTCNRSRNLNCSCGRLASTPMAPFIVPKSTVGILAASLSGSFITRQPCRNLFTKSPR